MTVNGLGFGVFKGLGQRFGVSAEQKDFGSRASSCFPIIRSSSTRILNLNSGPLFVRIPFRNYAQP